MCDDENEGDEGGHGAPLALRPTKNSRRIPTDTSDFDQRAEKPESGSTQVDEDYIPSINALSDSKKLSNGYTLGRFRGKWFVFDDENRFVGKYVARERAEKEAFLRKDPPPPPSFGM